MYIYIKVKTTPQYYFATYFFANDILMVFAHYVLFVCQNILIGLNVITLKKHFSFHLFIVCRARVWSPNIIPPVTFSTRNLP